ncbi:hypothetical protein [Rheinheimera pleomorphica]|uniref:hypothetical protein n=1 Tax=Rheinheimera pleomorphica TaxID=2703963 RepID=UPI0014229DCC|nr:hypothetical protein [Rheinheimera pleomorphica]
MMKNLQHDKNHIIEAAELLNKVEGGTVTGSILTPIDYGCFNPFLCSVAMYGGVIDPIRFPNAWREL